MDLTNYDEIVDLVSRVVKEKLINNELTQQREQMIPIGISNRHIHVCRKALDLLYGEGYELTKAKDLAQPGEFAAKERVTVIGPKMRPIENVRIIGPIREFTQVELSATDGYSLGIDLPTRLSGDIKKTAPITVIGPKGSAKLKEGAIRALRHIHMKQEDAERFNVKNNDRVNVEIPGDSGLILYNVLIRVSETYQLELHIDTDEANAAYISSQAFGRILSLK